MILRRTAKSKGSQFEYDCQASFEQIAPTTRTSERGYQRQYDLKVEFSNQGYYAVECKRLKGISWNELIKYYKKLKAVAPDAGMHYVLFKPNMQPCLVFYEHDSGYVIKEFFDVFSVPFIKHESTRRRVENTEKNP